MDFERRAAPAACRGIGGVPVVEVDEGDPGERRVEVHCVRRSVRVGEVDVDGLRDAARADEVGREDGGVVVCVDGRGGAPPRHGLPLGKLEAEAALEVHAVHANGHGVEHEVDLPQRGAEAAFQHRGVGL